jgi:hypothetical protein
MEAAKLEAESASSNSIRPSLKVRTFFPTPAGSRWSRVPNRIWNSSLVFDSMSLSPMTETTIFADTMASTPQPVADGGFHDALLGERLRVFEGPLLRNSSQCEPGDGRQGAT